jgi:hypothetical protein
MKSRTTGTQILERKFRWEIITQNEDHQVVVLQVNPNSKRSTQIPPWHLGNEIKPKLTTTSNKLIRFDKSNSRLSISRNSQQPLTN